MIEVEIKLNGEILARMEIKSESLAEEDLADYSVKYAVERGSAIGLHKRMLYGFPRKRYNALALLRQALMTLEEKELELERGFDPDATNENDRSADLARRLGRALRSL